MWDRFKAQIAHNISFFFAAPVVLWQLLFFLLPLCTVIVLSVVMVGQPNIPQQLTLTPFLSFFTATYARVIARSLLLALTNACLCLAVAYPTAYFLAFKAGRVKNILLFLLIVPFWTNFLLHVYAWFFVLEREGFLNTFLHYIGLINQPLHILNTLYAVSIMMVYYYLPFMVLPIYTLLEKFDYRFVEASLDLGATWGQTVRKVMIPITLPGILSGFFLVFVPSFAEFAIPELLGGDKKMFVGTVVSHYILGGTTISYGAAFTLLSSAALIVSALVLYPCIKKVVKIL